MAPPNQQPFRDYWGEQPYHPSYRRNYERRDDQWVSRDEDYHYGSRRDAVRRGGGSGYRVGHHRNSGSARYHRDDRNYHKENKVASSRARSQDVRKQEPSGNVVGRDLKTPIKRKRSPYKPSAPKKAKKNIQEDNKNNKNGGDITDEESNELDEIAKLKAAITDKNKQIVELRKKSILRQGTIRIKDDLIIKNRKLENTIMDLKAELEKFKNNEESLKSTASNLEEKIEALELQLVQKNNSSGDSGKAEVSEKNVVISDLELKLTRKTDVIKKEIKKNSDLLKENKRLCKERDSARNDAKKLEVEKGHVADQNEVLKRKLEAVKSKNKSLTKDIKDRNDKLLKAQTVFEEKLKELSISQLGHEYMSQQEVDSVSLLASVGIKPREKSVRQ